MPLVALAGVRTARSLRSLTYVLELGAAGEDDVEEARHINERLNTRSPDHSVTDSGARTMSETVPVVVEES